VQRFLTHRAKVCLSYGTAAHNYLVNLGVPPERIVVGVNAVDSNFFSEKAKIAQSQAGDLKGERALTGVNLLYVGNLVPLKGIDYLLEALAQVNTQVANFHLHLVGTGPHEGVLREKASRLGLTNRLTFWGSVAPEDVPRFYALADIFVFPSLYDVWGLVLNEAMACELPVIASNMAGATQDLVEDGINGIAVDPRDVSSFASALTRLITDPELRERMGKAAALTIGEKATIEHSASAFVRAVEMALS
jgi:glycosyltransferase involved in cell wall biosynthesis